MDTSHQPKAPARSPAPAWIGGVLLLAAIGAVCLFPIFPVFEVIGFNVPVVLMIGSLLLTGGILALRRSEPVTWAATLGIGLILTALVIAATGPLWHVFMSLSPVPSILVQLLICCIPAGWSIWVAVHLDRSARRKDPRSPAFNNGHGAGSDRTNTGGAFGGRSSHAAPDLRNRPPQVNRFGLPDQGEWLVRQYGGNVEVAAEVARIRRTDGSIVRADLQGYGSPKMGPLKVLLSVTSIEAITFRVWAENGFGMLQRRSMGRKAQQMCEESGVAVATAWVLENAPRSLSLAVLGNVLDADGMISTHGLERVINEDLNNAMRKWRR